MELRHLRYFKAVAELGSFTAAAKRLHVAQSSVSEQIGDLEAEIGGALLDRSARQVRLTAQGRVFLAEANKTLEASERAIDLTRQSIQGEIGTLSVGFFLWGAGGFFPRIIREFRRRRPGIRLSLLDMHATEQLVALEEGRIDVGFTRPLEPPFDRTLRSELLYRDPIVVAMRPDHPLAKGDVRLKDLAKERLVVCDRVSAPLLFDSFMTLCADHKATPNIVNTSATWAGLLTLAEAGEGLALVPAGVRHLRSKGLAYVNLIPGSLSLGLSVAWNPNNQGVALKEFLDLLRENKPRIQRTGGN